MPNPVLSGKRVLLVGVRDSICALPLANVIETMRPLPFETIAGAPSYVSGAAIVRGVPTPVVNLGMVLGMPDDAVSRFVALRLGNKQVVVSVKAVLGVRYFEKSATDVLPPLLQQAAMETIESIGTLDEQMLLVFRDSWMVPDVVWRKLATQERS